MDFQTVLSLPATSTNKHVAVLNLDTETVQ